MKAIITDLDRTLWEGTAVEGDVELHTYYWDLLLTLQEEGILVGVASKNDVETITPLLDKFGCNFFPVEANWGFKSEMVKRILAVWNISAEDVLFIDDNVFQLKEVKDHFPEINTLLFEQTHEFLGVIRYLFPEKDANEEDELRQESIKAGVKFNRELASMDTEEFFKSLNAKITVYHGNSPRALELINKTNQFNINGVRHKPEEFAMIEQVPGNYCITFEYEDRFGKLGVIGIIQGFRIFDLVTVSSFALSCRAFGRRIEYVMYEYLKRWTIDEPVFSIQKTNKNRKAIEFLLSDEKFPPLYPEVKDEHRDS